MRAVTLGKNQKFLLTTMSRDGRGGFPGYGWCWRNYSTTATMLDALVKLGLVAVTVTPSKVVNGVYKPERKDWKLTPLGKAVGKGHATLVKS